MDPAQLMLGAFLLSAALTLPIALTTGTFIGPHATWGAAGPAVVLSGLANVVAYVGYVRIIGRGGPVFAGQVSYIVTGFSILRSSALLSDDEATAHVHRPFALFPLVSLTIHIPKKTASCATAQFQPLLSIASTALFWWSGW